MYRLNNSSHTADSWGNTADKSRTSPKLWKKKEKEADPTEAHHNSSLSQLKMYYASCLTQWNVKYSFFICPMKQMDFLCAYCDTILKLCHYMSGKALLTMVVMATVAKSQHVQFLVAWLSFGGVSVILYNPFISEYMLSVLSSCFIFIVCTSSNHSTLFSKIPTSVPAGVCCWLETSIIDLTARKLCKNNTNDNSNVEIKVLMYCCC